MHLHLPLAIVFFLASTLCGAAPSESPSVVEVKRTGGGFQLLRNGRPYQIKGVGGQTKLDLLKQLGGNSIRTWSTDGLSELLDAAHERGLTVCVGMWLGHERHGFDYQDESSVTEQLRKCIDAVKQYKDHPAVLMWGVGNEMEGDGHNPAIWYAVDHIAREIKAIDPNHPTMTVIAELGDHKLRSIEQFCPHVDIVGVNSYGGISSLADRYRKGGGTKPYVVTEHGPLGPWEVEKTAWGSPLEENSSEKAIRYANGYQTAVAEQADLCFGSYAFLWGHKQETTATWFGMLLPDGSRLAAADAMSNVWTGSPPANRCPRIDSLKLDQASGLKPGQTVRAVLRTTDPEDDELTITWVLRKDSGTIGVGGDAQAAQTAHADAVNASSNTATVTVPANGGGYRLFAYVRDGQGGAAVANTAFSVDAPVKPIPSPKAKLPYVIYGDDAPTSTYTPSGYMGNADAITMTLDCTETPHAGKTCLKIEYDDPGNWGGVVWQSPPNDWDGVQPGGLDLSGATELQFYARGAKGGETVNFVIGVLDGNQPYRDTAKAELNSIQLSDQWQRFRIPLQGRDLRRIKTGFGWSLAGQGDSITFYLDEIRYVGED
jgi:hypothetical protein